MIRNMEGASFSWRVHRQELVDAVKLHAVTHYSEGWDVVVETMDDDDINDIIGLARTPAGAIKKFAPIVGVWADRIADARNSAF